MRTRWQIGVLAALLDACTGVGGAPNDTAGTDGGDGIRCRANARCGDIGEATGTDGGVDDDGVLVGGGHGDGATAGGDAGGQDHSAWSPGGWNDRTPELLPIAWPDARAAHTLVYDSGRKVVVLYGGGNTTERFDDVWERDADGLWTPAKIGSSRAPVSRDSHAAAYDAARSRMVVFGGQGVVANLGDTWDYDGASATWNQRAVAQGATWPTPHFGHTLTFLPEIGRSLMLGGCCAGATQAVWEWSGASGTWSDPTPSPVPTAWPGARRYQSAARDPERGVLWMFGGAERHPDDDNVALDELWEYDPTTREWTDRTPEPRPAAWPSSRFMHAMAYDAARARLVVFGGTAGGPRPWKGLGDLWEYDPDAHTWSEFEAEAPSAAPAPRWAHAMAYDETREAVVIFGGLTFGPVGEERLRDTWEYRP